MSPSNHPKKTWHGFRRKAKPREKTEANVIGEGGVVSLLRR